MAATKRGQCCHEHVVGDTTYYCVEPFGHQCAHSYRPSMHEVERLAKRIADLERQLAAITSEATMMYRLRQQSRERMFPGTDQGEVMRVEYPIITAALKETP